MKEYRTDSPGPGVRLPDIADTPIGQSSLFPEIEAEQSAVSALLTDRFVVPPFSVLDGRAGYWQERKAQWLALGIKGELGREEASRPNGGSHTDYRPGIEAEGKYEGGDAWHSFTGGGTSASVFDPVVCELTYRWFARPGGTVLDPFAGGSVRGVIAALLGHTYTGVDLSGPQVRANREQATLLVPPSKPTPTWVEGDARYLPNAIGSAKFDLVFSCPPYFDLEVYSDNPADLSAMRSYEDFLVAYSAAIGHSLAALKPERFAVWVIGEVRDKQGWQRGFVSDTIQLFRQHGARLYNEAVLVTPVGTVMLRAPKQFVASRVLGRTHQTVLVFYKGDVRPKWGTGEEVDVAA